MRPPDGPHDPQPHGRTDGKGKYIEIDETLVGGYQCGGKRGRGGDNKTVVLGLVERGGEMLVKVVPNVKAGHLAPAY